MLRINTSLRGVTSVTAMAILSVLVSSGCANKTPAPENGTPGSSSGASTTINIGEYGSMTGDESTFGVSTDNGVQLAVSQINKAGGVNGTQLSVIKEDDEGKADVAPSVVKKIIDENHPTAILGEVASKLSIQAAPVCNGAGVPMISPSSTNPKVTQVGNYIFRVCFIDPFQGTAAAKFAVQTLHMKRAAIMTDAANDYSTGLTKFFTDAFQKLGGTIVATQDYTKDDQIFQAQLNKIKAANPDILYVPGYYGQVGPIAKQAKEIGLTVPLLGGDGWDSPNLVKGAGGPGGALEGCYFTDHYSVSNPDPTIQKFVTDFKGAYNNQVPDSLAAMGYDATQVLADAIKRAGKPSDGDYASASYRDKVRDAIASTTNFAGVTGKITIDKDRNATKPAVVLQVKGDQYQYVTTVNP